ncbi:putative orf [Danaus plexippus plexippus]|uniref:Orf n=1 Tax=Danaus plexippus plexippus TaxID=278856 RepID=A0A212FI61_DANPL|nr:putative orf [Danaus plexippus plexippus]
MRSEVADKIEKEQAIAKDRFDKHRRLTHIYSEGDLVRIERMTFDKDRIGKSKKLMPKFHGPYRIIKVLSKDRYVVGDTPLTRKGNKRYENVVSIDKIHPWLNFRSIESENDTDTHNSGEESDIN